MPGRPPSKTFEFKNGRWLHKTTQKKNYDVKKIARIPGLLYLFLSFYFSPPFSHYTASPRILNEIRINNKRISINWSVLKSIVSFWHNYRSDHVSITCFLSFFNVSIIKKRINYRNKIIEKKYFARFKHSFVVSLQDKKMRLNSFIQNVRAMNTKEKRMFYSPKITGIQF